MNADDDRVVWDGDEPIRIVVVGDQGVDTGPVAMGEDRVAGLVAGKEADELADLLWSGELGDPLGGRLLGPVDPKSASESSRCAFPFVAIRVPGGMIDAFREQARITPPELSQGNSPSWYALPLRYASGYLTEEAQKWTRSTSLI